MKGRAGPPKENSTLEHKPKILCLDIETAPHLIWAWTTYDTHAIEVEREGFVLSCAFKWLGRKGFVLSLPDYKHYSKDKFNDRELVKDIWKYLDEADIVLAHNGRAFDIKKLNGRFFHWGLPPPSPYETIDTLKNSRANFSFYSHRLNEIAKQRKLGEKVETGGWPLWKRCINGDTKAWRKMCRYNIHDVELLEKVYREMRPWIKNHPAVAPQKGKDFNGKCTRCGSQELQKRGQMVSQGRIYQRFQCKKCAGWMKKLNKVTNA